MFTRIKSFLENEAGAVTVDWVVLCAGIVGLCVAILASMQTGTLGLTDSIQIFMSSWFD